MTDNKSSKNGMPVRLGCCAVPEVVPLPTTAVWSCFSTSPGSRTTAGGAGLAAISSLVGIGYFSLSLDEPFPPGLLVVGQYLIGLISQYACLSLSVVEGMHDVAISEMRNTAPFALFKLHWLTD